MADERGSAILDELERENATLRGLVSALSQAVEELCAGRAAAEQARWRPIETLEPMAPAVVWVPDWVMLCAAWQDEEGVWWTPARRHGRTHIPPPSHWMPHPEPPEKETSLHTAGQPVTQSESSR